MSGGHDTSTPDVSVGQLVCQAMSLGSFQEREHQAGEGGGGEGLGGLALEE